MRLLHDGSTGVCVCVCDASGVCCECVLCVCVCDVSGGGVCVLYAVWIMVCIVYCVQYCVYSVRHIQCTVCTVYVVSVHSIITVVFTPQCRIQQ